MLQAVTSCRVIQAAIDTRERGRERGRGGGADASLLNLLNESILYSVDRLSMLVDQFFYVGGSIPMLVDQTGKQRLFDSVQKRRPGSDQRVTSWPCTPVHPTAATLPLRSTSVQLAHAHPALQSHPFRIRRTASPSPVQAGRSWHVGACACTGAMSWGNAEW